MSYKCKQCCSTFTEWNRISRHACSPDNECEDSSCPCCGQEFACDSLMRKHIINHEIEKKPHIINNPTICGNIKWYTCMFCPKQCNSIWKLNSHIRVHTGNRPFRCHLCGDAFKQKGGLTRHIKSTHDAQQNICDQCGEKFVNKSDLKLHMNIQHTATKRPFSCMFCGFKVENLSTLNKHILVHTGTRPYKCTQCGDRFKQKCDLNKHMITHTGEKPFTCALCNKSFGLKGNLKRHILNHADEEKWNEHNNEELEKDMSSPTMPCEITDSSQLTPGKTILDDFDDESSVSYNNECESNHSYESLNSDLYNERKLFFDCTNGDLEKYKFSIKLESPHMAPVWFGVTTRESTLKFYISKKNNDDSISSIFINQKMRNQLDAALLSYYQSDDPNMMLDSHDISSISALRFNVVDNNLVIKHIAHPNTLIILDKDMSYDYCNKKCEIERFIDYIHKKKELIEFAENILIEIVNSEINATKDEFINMFVSPPNNVLTVCELWNILKKKFCSVL